MHTEIEAKFADIDVSEVRDQLAALKAELIHGERQMIREVFDYPDKRLEKIGGWIRLRDEGDRITLCYKQLNNRSLHGTKEVEVVVNDFVATREFLLDIRLTSRSIQETKREKWLVGKVEVVIDTWPWVPTFIEIEAEDEASVRQVADQLGMNWSKVMHGSVEIVYQKYFDVTEAEIDSWPEVRFSPVPEWLEKKRRK